MPIEKRIQEIDVELRDLLDELNYIKEELKKKENKEHKSLSDYRIYKPLKIGEEYKNISVYNNILKFGWSNGESDEIVSSYGNIYSIKTPDELLEREIKKRQLWFALEKHLKENNCLATSEDWKDENKYKYFVYFDCCDETFGTDCECAVRYNTIYSKSENVLRNYMDTLTTEDIKIMFDVE